MTYEECLSMLTEEEQEKFIVNLKKGGDAEWVSFYENNSYPNMTNFVASAFEWQKSLEGANYWMDVFSRF